MKETKLKNYADFSGKNIYVGMDVHKKSWAISLYYDQMLIRTITQPPSVDVLENFLRKSFPGANYLCGYESGFCGFWIYRSLSQRGINCKVIHAADLPQTNKGRVMRNDKNDSKRIGLSLANESVHSIHVPDIISESDRSLIRYRTRLIRDITRSKNRIKSLLFQYGIMIPIKFDKSWSKNFLGWVSAVAGIELSLKFTLLTMIEQIESLRKLLLKVNKEIRKLIQEPRIESKISLIKSIPGIGPVTAITLISEIIDIKRFGSFVQLNSFVGLCPMEYSSGEQDHKGHITHRQHRQLRSLLVEASWIAIRHDPALLLYYKNCTLRMSGKRAIIKVARRLLHRIYRVWKTGEPYETGREK